MTERHVVIGAGPVGSAVAEQLADQGHSVRILTRTGNGPTRPEIERRSVDIETDDLSTHFDGAAAIYHCAHAAYATKVWRRTLPAMDRRVLDAAAGTVVVFPESLYAYGRVDGPIHEDAPRQATHRKLGVRSELLAAREAHPNPTVSVAASDFYGPRVTNAHMGDRVIARILERKAIRVIASADLPHSFTYVPDLAAAMITAAASAPLWNSVLHAPTAPAVSQRTMIEAFSTAAGLPAPKVTAIPASVMKVLSVVPGAARELADTLYQFRLPFVLDSDRSAQALGLHPTPLAEGATATIAWWNAAEPAMPAPGNGG